MDDLEHKTGGPPRVEQNLHVLIIKILKDFLEVLDRSHEDVQWERKLYFFLFPCKFPLQPSISNATTNHEPLLSFFYKMSRPIPRKVSQGFIEKPSRRYKISGFCPNSRAQVRRKSVFSCTKIVCFLRSERRINLKEFGA